MILEVKITPYAAKNALIRWEGQRLVLRIQGVPEKGRVNENMLAFLAEILRLSKSQIRLLSGATSRLKKLSIEGIPEEQIRLLLKEHLETP